VETEAKLQLVETQQPVPAAVVVVAGIQQVDRQSTGRAVLAQAV
jgi:hypothetical protein